MDMDEFRRRFDLLSQFPNECYDELKNTFEIASRKFVQKGEGFVYRVGPMAGFLVNDLDFTKTLEKTTKGLGHEENIPRFKKYLTYLNRSLKE